MILNMDACWDDITSDLTRNSTASRHKNVDNVCDVFPFPLFTLSNNRYAFFPFNFHLYNQCWKVIFTWKLILFFWFYHIVQNCIYTIYNKSENNKLYATTCILKKNLLICYWSRVTCNFCVSTFLLLYVKFSDYFSTAQTKMKKRTNEWIHKIKAL